MPVCKKCGTRFPNWVTIDGKKRNLVGRKFCLDCSPFGAHNTLDLSHTTNSKRQYIENDDSIYECTKCHQKLPASDFYGKNRPNGEKERHKWCKDCFKDDIEERRKTKKAMSVEYLGGKCIKCGYDKNYASLEFHHRESEEKEWQLNHLMTSSFERIKKELDKCDLMCGNCHNELHHPEASKENMKKRLLSKTYIKV